MTEQEMTNKVRQVIKHTDDRDIEVKMTRHAILRVMEMSERMK